jgi:hypothetical protein
MWGQQTIEYDDQFWAEHACLIHKSLAYFFSYNILSMHV